MAGLLELVLSGCQTVPPSPALPASCAALAAKASVQITLMFGLTTPEHQAIREQDWQDFLQRDVSSRFPMGLTVLSGEGKWRPDEASPTESEPSRLVWIVTADTPDLPVRIGAIRRAYRTRFHQQSVGVSLTRACSAF
ncbi:DUF3574 domain-containing protein [Acetobacter conturbans]|uniref:DUF3574 domain-containing protein n=1 Tax=Acetobacter conturbans TaxID=1737472 RepID=UPI0030D609A7